MVKSEIRKTFISERKNISNKEMEALNDLMLIHFQKAHLPFISHLLSYWPIAGNKEPDTHLFADFLKFKNPGLQISYPVSDFTTGIMHAFATDDETEFTVAEKEILEPVSNIMVEPDQIDIVFVPLLAFDKSGNRVGYGKGFYDRYLSVCRLDCVKVGFSFFEPIEDITDKDEFDIPLNICVTPKQLYVF